MSQVTLEEAGAKLAALINEVIAGREIIITKGNEPVAKLVSVQRKKAPRKPGSAKGQVVIAPDFKALLSDFDEYQ